MSQERLPLRPKAIGEVLWVVIAFLLVAGSLPAGGNQSDLNKDGVVDLEDVKLFSLKMTGQDWQTIEWCQWIADHPKHEKRYADLYAFIRDYFQCDGEPPPPPPPPPGDPLAVVNKLTHPTRLTWDSGDRLYVSDAKVGSVFIYEADFTLSGELKDLSKPLGLLVDDTGQIWVGNNGRDNVEIYSPQGEKLATLGEAILGMPNSLVLDRDSYLYVADSSNDRVCVFDSSGAWVQNIGETELGFPAAVAIQYWQDPNTGQDVGELFVADQKHYLIRVYDLQGNALRSFGGQGTTGGMMGNKFYWNGKFVRVCGLDFAPDGNLHAVDCYINVVQILDPLSGAYLGHYGTRGSETGQLWGPLDVAINPQGQRAVSNTLNKRIELFE